MGKCKTKVIQTDLGIFMHIPEYSGIIRYIQELIGHIQEYSEPCVIVAHLQPWYIHNPDIFITRSIFRTLEHSQPWYI